MRTFRSRGQFVGGVAIAIVSVGVGTGSIFSARTPIFAVLWAVCGVAFALMGLRLAYACVKADERGIRVVNIFESLTLTWSEIDAFGIGRWKLFPAICLIHLRDGRREHAFGLQESTNYPNSSAQKMIDQLNDELVRRRFASLPAGGSDERKP